jgi:hypothetical protein
MVVPCKITACEVGSTCYAPTISSSFLRAPSQAGASEGAFFVPKEFRSYQGRRVDSPDLAAGFIVWLCSGSADWAKGRFLSSNWDAAELSRLKDRIPQNDLLVNRLRAKTCGE